MLLVYNQEQILVGASHQKIFAGKFFEILLVGAKFLQFSSIDFGLIRVVFYLCVERSYLRLMLKPYNNIVFAEHKKH